MRTLRKLDIFITAMFIFVLTGCATAQQAPLATVGSTQLSPTPVQATPSQLSQDLADAAARATAAAAAAKDPNVQKLASDRALCYSTLNAHVQAFIASVSSLAANAPKGIEIMTTIEGGLEYKDTQATGSNAVIPLDIQANCASFVAQQTAAINDVILKIANLAGLKSNVMFAPINAAASAGVATVKGVIAQ